MKIENVDLPCMCKYYIAERYIDLLKGSLLHADVIISGDILHCNMKYDETIFYVLKTILDKTEKITIGSIGMFCSFCSTWGKLCYDKYSGSRNQ